MKMSLDEFRQVNQVHWNERTHIHAASRLYDIDSYIADPHKISDVVQFDAADLGNVRGYTLLHLQCHIGTDTLSLARLGATVTGIDFSPDAIETARKLSVDCGTPARFEVAELYDTPHVINDRFDIVYTGVGALTWLPDIAAWGRVVATMLKPGGMLFVRDFHPMLWTIDDRQDTEALVVTYPYFETQPVRFENEYTYSDGDRLTHTVNYEWNHGLGEIVMSLIDNGLQLNLLREHKIAESRNLPCMVPDADGRWRLPHNEDRLPLMYTIRAAKPA
jgi:2-polyprenyl-3-methyl-5-hydroxy-6-metoxy-1,4-benzoquinol methylase